MREYFLKNAFDLLQKIYNDDFTYVFDFEKICPELEVTLRHLSLFSVCVHFLTCLRSCDRVANYCFYCSHVRSYVYGDWSHFHDVVVATQDKVYKDHYICIKIKYVILMCFLRSQFTWIIQIILLIKELVIIIVNCIMHKICLYHLLVFW